jgi:hypothetical protein
MRIQKLFNAGLRPAGPPQSILHADLQNRHNARLLSPLVPSLDVPPHTPGEPSLKTMGNGQNRQPNCDNALVL